MNTAACPIARGEADAVLRLARIGHSYLGRTVVDGVDLDVSRSEVVALVGPSGCGKSTLVHVAAEVVSPTRGRVERRFDRQGMVFQDPRLLPWATALDNIAYPLALAGVARAARRERARVAAARVELAEEDLDKFPVELSGGMRQRTAIARALVVAPDFVFFDEPFTALDVALKRRMQDLVIAAAGEARFSALFVTHDLAEAARIADRIVIMDTNGRGLVGERRLPGRPGTRDDAEVYRLVSGFLADDPLFRHVNDIDERRRA